MSIKGGLDVIGVSNFFEILFFKFYWKGWFLLGMEVYIFIFRIVLSLRLFWGTL